MKYGLNSFGNHFQKHEYFNQVERNFLYYCVNFLKYIRWRIIFFGHINVVSLCCELNQFIKANDIGCWNNVEILVCDTYFKIRNPNF